MDLLAGKPSATVRRLAVVAFLAAVALQLRRPSNAPPALLKSLDARLSQLALPPWKLFLLFLGSSIAAENIFLLLFLNPPELNRGVYKPSFFRAQKILEALDSGFWTAMNIEPAPLRHVLSLLFSIYFVLNPSKAEDVCRRFRAQATVKQLRLSWEKGHINPILRGVRWLTAPDVKIVKEIMLPRPVPASPSAFDGTPGAIRTILYFDGDAAELKRSDGLILHFPGGGFCSMPPEVHEDYLRLWTKDTGLPVLSIDYGKAPEFPYPWALEECFDAYRTIVESNGEAIGMGGWYVELVDGRKRRRKPIRIAVAGDSAGGNLAAAVVFKILEFSLHHLPAPSGVLLTYPALSFDMAAWMPSDEIELLRAESRKSLAGKIGSSASVGSMDKAGANGHAGKGTSAGPPTGLVASPSFGPGGSILLKSASQTNFLTTEPTSEPAVSDFPKPNSDLRRKRTLSFVEKHHRGMLGGFTSFDSLHHKDSSAPKKAPMPTSKSAADLRQLEMSSPLAPRPALSVPAPRPAGSKAASQDGFSSWFWAVWDKLTGWRAVPSSRKAPLPTTHRNVNLTSRFAFSGDKVLPPEVVRSLALLYVGNSPYPPDFGSDYFLNPNVAPDDLLARFPRVYLICGEKDPMVDDTVVFAGRVREAKMRAHRQWLKLKEERKKARKSGAGTAQFGLNEDQVEQRWKDADLSTHPFARDPSEMVHTRILEGMSHGWLNIIALLPEAKDIVRLNAAWLLELVAEDDRIPRWAPFPGYVRTSGREALAEEELTEVLIRRMEQEDGEGLQDVVEVPARAGYYASVPAQIHRYLHPEMAHGAVHDRDIREQWQKEAEEMGMSVESSEDEDEAGEKSRTTSVLSSSKASSAVPSPVLGGVKPGLKKSGTGGSIRPASARQSRLRVSPQPEEQSDEEDEFEDDSPITMKVRKPASDLATPALSSAELTHLSDVELIKRRKEEVEHALTDYHLNRTGTGS